MRKYIIKNCPAIYKKLRMNENHELYIDEYRCNRNTFYACQDCTDCVMKQIVDYCLENEKYGDGYYTNPILKLLDIQEVE